MPVVHAAARRVLGGTKQHPKRAPITEASKLAGEKFKAELARMGISQSWLARQLGLSHATVYSWASGRQPVPKYAAFTLSLLRKLHDEDTRASEEHVAWLLHLIVHGEPMSGDGPVSRVIAARKLRKG